MQTVRLQIKNIHPLERPNRCSVGNKPKREYIFEKANNWTLDIPLEDAKPLIDGGELMVVGDVPPALIKTAPAVKAEKIVEPVNKKLVIASKESLSDAGDEVAPEDAQIRSNDDLIDDLVESLKGMDRLMLIDQLSTNQLFAGFKPDLRASGDRLFKAIRTFLQGKKSLGG